MCGHTSEAFVRGYADRTLMQLLAAAGVSPVAVVVLFHRGLRRYESGGMVVAVR